MKLDRLKDDYPSIPENIKMMIEQEVKKQVETNSRPNADKPRRLSTKKISLMILAATMLLGTTVFAGTRLYQWYVEKEGAYGVKVALVPNEKDDTEEGNEALSVPSEIPVLDIKMDYLPEHMVRADDGSEKFYFTDTPYQGGISITPIAMDKEFSADHIQLSDTNVIHQETMTINGKDLVYLEKDVKAATGTGYDKKIYLSCPEYWQILEIFVGEDVSKEDALKMVEHMKIQPTDKTKPLSESYCWSDRMNVQIESGEPIATAPRENFYNIHQIGESFAVAPAIDEGTTESAPDLYAKVTEVQTADDLLLLNPAYMDADLKKALDGNGKLMKNTITYLKAGDGIDTLDEIISTEDVDQKLVYATVEYTNTGNTEMHDVLVFCSFVGLIDNGTDYEIYDRANDKRNENADYFTMSSIGRTGEMSYYDVRGGEGGKNYISSLAPGETVTVHFAKIVNEDELDKLYLSLDTSGAAYEFTDSSLAIGYVDIRH